MSHINILMHEHHHSHKPGKTVFGINIYIINGSGVVN
jgi:hypothetical protein